ncbi:RNA polymerase sigma factor [Mucilaginibacter lutimaris]|uniref:RNA polymerase sigma factor n=1 Tax=Mucilaginibacter lutimaris TaxID=931629 RepID=A0ABW2ZAC8_9SPHI
MAIKSVHNESELLVEIGKGNEKAFASLFYAYHNQIAEYVVLLTASTELAEEIVQDVFVKIWQNKHKLHEVEKFTAYLFILTRNYTLNSIRKNVGDKKKQDAYNLSIVNDEEVIALDDPLSDPENQNLIERAIAQLPPSQHRVFLLKQEGRKNADIANELGLSAESVKKYQQWAIKSVAEFVRAHKELSAIFIAIGIMGK